MPMGFESWLQRWKKRYFGLKPFRTTQRVHKRTPIWRLGMEELEGRVVPTAISLIANTPTLSWNNPATCSTGTVPTINDTVTISTSVSGTISTTNNDSVLWLNDTSGNLSIASGGSLTIAANSGPTILNKNVTVLSGGSLA